MGEQYSSYEPSNRLSKLYKETPSPHNGGLLVLENGSVTLLLFICIMRYSIGTVQRVTREWKRSIVRSIVKPQQCALSHVADPRSRNERSAGCSGKSGVKLAYELGPRVVSGSL